MKNWELLENECITYLQNKYPAIKFEWTGKENPTKSDILIRTKNMSFYIEVKSPLSQCGQFVLIPDLQNQVFIYSSKNKSPIFDPTKKIISYMDFNFAKYVNATTIAKEINLDESIYANWIIDYYSFKQVRFVITKNKEDYLIFPLHKIADYFQIKCFYRIKKSGSSHTTVFSKNDLITWWKLSVNGKFIVENKKLYFNSNDDLQNHKIHTLNSTYLLHQVSSNKYEIRKLSNTFNANVIFQIKLKGDSKQSLSDLEEFKSTLKD